METLSKKEQYDLDKAKKVESKKENKTIKKAVVWLFGIVVVLGLSHGVHLMIVNAEKAEVERPGDSAHVQDTYHIQVEDHHDEYVTNPPTSGPHGPVLSFGVYTEELLDENIVHNLEHGGIWISYTGISEEEISKLEEISDNHPNSVIMTPRSKNDTPIAVVSWGRLMKLDSVDVDLIEEYIEQNINKSPEPLVR